MAPLEEDQMIKDQQEKLELTLKTLSEHCTEDSEFETIRIIAKALKSGNDKLIGQVVSGGKTNYAYAIRLEQQPDVAIFCKICFSYALWNPDRSQAYDLKRVENEFDSMKQFQILMSGPDGKTKAPVATPYFCLDVQDMKLIACEYAKSDEQWANQFVDGHVDTRIVPQLARALAKLNTSECDPMFNDNVRPCMQNMMGLGQNLMEGLATSTNETIDKAILYSRKIGPERSKGIFVGMEKSYMKREAFIHSDVQAFNILVERKPSIETFENFGPDGAWVLCDWEMIFCGDVGRDIGTVQGWPLACAFYHAVGGHKEEAYNMLDCCTMLFDSYAKALVEECNKDDEYVLKCFRSSMGWISYFVLFAYYLFGMWNEDLPIAGLSEEDKAKAKSSMGFMGIRFAEIGFQNDQPDLTLSGLRSLYRDIMVTEIEDLLTFSAQKHARAIPRRASVLRASGRRVSDASGMEEAAASLVQRLSLTGGNVIDALSED